LDFANRLPGVNVPERPSHNQGLGNNAADRSPLLESFLGNLFMDAGGDADVNLAVESSGHRAAPMYTNIPRYINLVKTLPFRAPAFGARNLHFRNSKQLQIPRYAGNDNLAEVSQYCASLIDG
jgi:hypothetical protein